MTFSQDSAGVPGVVEAGDRFGRSLDTVRVGGTRRLAVGIPGEDVGSASNAGSVQLFTFNGVSLDPGVGLTQDTAGVSGAAVVAVRTRPSTRSGYASPSSIATRPPRLSPTTVARGMSTASISSTTASASPRGVIVPPRGGDSP